MVLVTICIEYFLHQMLPQCLYTVRYFPLGQFTIDGDSLLFDSKSTIQSQSLRGSNLSYISIMFPTLSYSIAHNLYRISVRLLLPCILSLSLPLSLKAIPPLRLSQSADSILCFRIIISPCKIAYRSVWRINVVRYSFSSVRGAGIGAALIQSESSHSCLCDGIRLNCLQGRSSFLVELEDSTSFLSIRHSVRRKATGKRVSTVPSSQKKYSSARGTFVRVASARAN